MGRWTLLSEQKRVEVEQGIARGWTTEHIAATVGCAPEHVEAVRIRMDVINETGDTETKRPQRIAS